MKNRFHYAFKVTDIESTRRFYVEILGCNEGRSTEHWIDFNFFGHQLSAHISNDIPPLDYCGKVDGIEVPIPHFGCILSIEQFKIVQQKLKNNCLGSTTIFHSFNTNNLCIRFYNIELYDIPMVLLLLF